MTVTPPPDEDPAIGAGSGHEPVVSVIMIFLNARKYIGAAIDSVLSQTFESWELVLVDDGSSDGSRELASASASKFPELIRVVEHAGRRNLGTGPSRNLGMRIARGRYLAFLDADDIYEPQRLERTVQLLESDPELGLVINSELYWRSWQSESAAGQRRSLKPDEVVVPCAEYNRVIPPPVLIASTLATRGAAMPAPCSMTFRRQDVVDLGGVPEGFDSQYEDQALLARLLLSRSVMVIEDCLARYRRHPESLTHRARERGEYRPGQPHPARRQFISWLLDYMQTQGIDEPLLAEALRNEIEAHTGHTFALALSRVLKQLDRVLLLGANALLPRTAVDRLVSWRLARRKADAARRAARNAALIEQRHR